MTSSGFDDAAPAGTGECGSAAPGTYASAAGAASGAVAAPGGENARHARNPPASSTVAAAKAASAHGGRGFGGRNEARGARSEGRSLGTGGGGEGGAAASAGARPGTGRDTGALVSPSSRGRLVSRRALDSVVLGTSLAPEPSAPGLLPVVASDGRSLSQRADSSDTASARAATVALRKRAAGSSEQASVDQFLELGGKLGRELAHGQVPTRLDSREDLDERRAVERRNATQALERDHAEGPDIDGGSGLIAPDLLGRHVVRGSEDRVGGGERHGTVAVDEGVVARGGLARRWPRNRLGIAQELGDAEVEHLDRLAAVLLLHDDQVVGLEVAVHDAEGVGAVERAGRLLQEAHGGALRKPPQALEPVAHRLAVEQLHHDEGPARLGDPEIEDLDGVAGLDLRGQLRFGHEALSRRFLLRRSRVQELDRDVGLEGQVAGAPDFAHASASEPLFELVAIVDAIACC